jgi:Xaa-Pro aminopeptidase
MEEIKKFMSKNNLKYIVLFNGEKANLNLVYFANYFGYGSLVISPDEMFLYVPELEFERAKKTGIKTVKAEKRLFEFLEEGNVGLDFENMSFKEVQGLKEKSDRDFVDVSDFMKKLRIVKNDDEILKMRKACEITDEIFEKLISNWDFSHEGEIVSFLFKETKLRGCDFAFEPIVASGKNASMPHHLNPKPLEKGFCVIDFGVKYEGYCSDITRTFYVGNPSEEEKELYERILNAQLKILGDVKEGAKCSELQKSFGEAVGQEPIHALGHGIGVDVHENPRFWSISEDVLKENMVVAIEPGYYIENKMGIRIEDTVLIGKEKSETLTKFRKDLVVVG